MRTIVAIGGGEIGRPGTKRETIAIDKHILSLTGKKHPRLLFIPTASGDSSGYISVVDKYFGDFLGCKTESLCLTQVPSAKTIEAKIEQADIIYVGGGNTKKMMSAWRKYNLAPLLREAWNSGTILTGVSAGAICWFSFAHSDSMKQKTGGYSRVKGLGFISGTCCPHTVREADRLPSFKKMLQRYGGVGYSIDDCAAIVFQDQQTYSIASKKGRHAQIYEPVR